MPWTVTHSTLYHQAGEINRWEDIDIAITDTAERAEALARHFANRAIACDDARFDGPGTPISSQITITWRESA